MEKQTFGMKAFLTFTTFVCILTTAWFISAPLAFAQQSQILDSFYDLQFIPVNPRPNENAVAEIVTYSTDINAADISWFINGKLQKNGVGEKKFSFRVGSAGTAITVSVVIKTQEGNVITKSTTLNPAGVEIFWQAKTHTPPFYKGKALFTSDSTATIVALPHFVGANGKEISAKNLIYKWKVGTKVQLDDSGYGKSSFELKPLSPLGMNHISVEVNSIDQTIFAEGKLDLEPTLPEVVIYPESPLYGTMFDHALKKDYTFTGNDLQVSMVPYFFSATPGNNNLSTTWKINGEDLPDRAQTGASATIRPPNEKPFELVLAVRDTTRSFQSATTRLTLKHSSR
jgi:hypothetical protein